MAYESGSIKVPRACPWGCFPYIMPIYKYKARDEEGRSFSGRIDVSGEEELQNRLESSGFFLVEFSLEKKSLLDADIAEKFLVVGLRNLYTLTLQLANIVDTGVPLLASLNSIVEGCRNRKLRAILKVVIKDLESGSSFAAALSKHPKVFSKFYTSMVELGEASGTLPKILSGLAEYIKKEMAIKRKIIFALSYPMFLTMVGTVLVIFVLTYIMPQFITIFTEEKIPLPLPTLILVTLSTMVTRYWYLLLVSLIGMVVGFRFFAQSNYGGLIVDRLKLRIPIMGEVIKKVCAKRFIDGLNLLYTSGLPILSALNTVKAIVRNRYFEKVIASLVAHLSTGKDLASYLRLNEFFPPDILAMIKSGEESGTLGKMLNKASSIYEEEVNYAIEMQVSAFEIGVIIVVGVGVGFVAMALLFPIFRLRGMIR